MEDIISNKAILTQMLERDAGNIYENLRGQAFELVGKNPMFKTIFSNYLKANESKWIATIQEKLDMIVEVAFIDPNTTLEQGIANSNELINTYIGQFLEEKLKIPSKSINVALQLLLGQQL